MMLRFFFARHTIIGFFIDVTPPPFSDACQPPFQLSAFALILHYIIALTYYFQ